MDLTSAKCAGCMPKQNKKNRSAELTVHEGSLIIIYDDSSEVIKTKPLLSLVSSEDHRLSLVIIIQMRNNASRSVVNTHERSRSGPFVAATDERLVHSSPQRPNNQSEMP